MKAFILIPFLLIELSLANDITLYAEIRERFEQLNGVNKKSYGNDSLDAKGKKSGSSDDSLLVQRIKLGFEYQQTTDITWRLIGYDSRVLGWSLSNNDFVKNAGTDEEYYMNSHEEFLELYSAYLEINKFLDKDLTLTLGRQTMHYGDKRIFGPGNWGNSVGWIWDGAKLSYNNDGNFIDLLYGQTKDKDPYKFSLFDRHVYEGAGLYSHFRTSENGAIEPFYVYKNTIRPTVKENNKIYEHTHNFGVRAYENNLNGFIYDATLTKQVGEKGSIDIDAYAYVLRGGYQFHSFAWKPKVIFGKIFASGDNNPNDNKSTTYTRPFGGTDGSLYGRMDIMFWSNLVQYETQLDLFITPKDSLRLIYHVFSLDEAKDTWSYYKYKNKEGFSDTGLGEEIDIVYKHSHSKSLEFQAIYTYFNAGSFVKNSVANNDANRLFLEFTYKFHLAV